MTGWCLRLCALSWKFHRISLGITVAFHETCDIVAAAAGESGAVSQNWIFKRREKRDQVKAEFSRLEFLQHQPASAPAGDPCRRRGRGDLFHRASRRWNVVG